MFFAIYCQGMENVLLCVQCEAMNATMTNQKRRRVLKTVGGAALIGTVAGCLGDEDDTADDDEMDDEMDDGMDDDAMDEEDEAALRAAHLSPDAPNVDVYLEGEIELEDVPFREVSDYLELEPGDYDLLVTAAGDEDTVVFDETVTVDANDYTAAAIGELEETNEPITVELFEDDLSDPESEARVRLIHASPDAPEVDITIDDGEEVLFESVAFGEAEAVEVEPDEYTLEVRPATDENDGDIVGEFEISPEEGAVYSAFAVGYLEPEAAPADEPFDLEVVVDSEAENGDDEDEADDE